METSGCLSIFINLSCNFSWKNHIKQINAIIDTNFQILMYLHSKRKRNYCLNFRKYRYFWYIHNNFSSCLNVYLFFFFVKRRKTLIFFYKNSRLWSIDKNKSGFVCIYDVKFSVLFWLKHVLLLINALSMKDWP